MSRKYLNDRWCVRCGRTAPTPYLKRNVKLLPKTGRVLDIGCGNGRNSRFMESFGYVVDAVDMVGDYGKKLVLGKDPLPKRYKYDIILANYILMFLGNEERQQVIYQISRVAKKTAYLVVEMYPAKDAYPYDFQELRLQLALTGFTTRLACSKDRCVLKRG